MFIGENIIVGGKGNVELKKGKITIEDDRLNTEYNEQEIPDPDVWVIEK